MRIPWSRVFLSDKLCNIRLLLFDADYDEILVPVNTGGAHQIIKHATRET